MRRTIKRIAEIFEYDSKFLRKYFRKWALIKDWGEAPGV
jgi:hypothetical protein